MLAHTRGPGSGEVSYRLSVSSITTRSKHPIPVFSNKEVQEATAYYFLAHF
jgi:hypothetical protein